MAAEIVFPDKKKENYTKINLPWSDINTNKNRIIIEWEWAIIVAYYSYP